MDRFKELTTFVEVAQRGSLSAAAREEGITPAMVGRRIDQLEERLAVKLFKRSTRKVTPPLRKPWAIQRPSVKPASSTPKITSESSPGFAAAKSPGRTRAMPLP